METPVGKYFIVATFKTHESELAGLIFEHLKKVNVFRDHSPIMTTLGELREKLVYVSQHDRDDFIIIALSAHARQYTRSIDEVYNARDDFRDGFRAHEKLIKAREEAREVARLEKEAAKPKFAVIDSRCNAYAVFENGCFYYTTSCKENATTWKTKAAAERARDECGPKEHWKVEKINEKKGDK